MKNRCTPQIDSNSPPDACASFQLIQLFLETVDSLQHVGTRWMLYLQKRWSRIHTSNKLTPYGVYRALAAHYSDELVRRIRTNDSNVMPTKPGINRLVRMNMDELPI